jgi:hypothetical protein
MEGLTFAMVLNLNMGDYHIALDVYSPKLSTNLFPWVKYKYKQLPKNTWGIGIPDKEFNRYLTNLRLP